MRVILNLETYKMKICKQFFFINYSKQISLFMDGKLLIAKISTRNININNLFFVKFLRDFVLKNHENMFKKIIIVLE